MMNMGAAGVGPGTMGSNDMTYNPFWFDLWQKVGWSRPVARIWVKETAYRGTDRSFLELVLPTLAPEHKTFVEDVLRTEASA